MRQQKGKHCNKSQKPFLLHPPDGNTWIPLECVWLKRCWLSTRMVISLVTVLVADGIAANAVAAAAAAAVLLCVWCQCRRWWWCCCCWRWPLLMIAPLLPLTTCGIVHRDSGKPCGNADVTVGEHPTCSQQAWGGCTLTAGMTICIDIQQRKAFQ